MKCAVSELSTRRSLGFLVDYGGIDHCDPRIMHHAGKQPQDAADVRKGIGVADRDPIDGTPEPDEVFH